MSGKSVSARPLWRTYSAKENNDRSLFRQFSRTHAPARRNVPMKMNSARGEEGQGERRREREGGAGPFD